MLDRAEMLASHADALPPRAGTSHDPFRARLSAATDWRVARTHDGETIGFDDTLATSDDLLQLAPLDNSLWDVAGTFGGLTLPRHVAISPSGDVFLLREDRLLILDPCTCTFIDVPGMTAGIAPTALAIRDNHLLIADPGAGLVHVRDRYTIRPHRPLQLPAGVADAPWQPTDVAANTSGRVAVGDPANGAIHIFAPSGAYIKTLTNIGAVSALAVDCDGALWVARGPLDPALKLDARHDQRETVTRRSDADANFNWQGLAENEVLRLGRFCEPQSDAIFDFNGESVDPSDVSNNDAYVIEGTLLSGPIDSKLHDCLWDITVTEASTPPGCRIVFETMTANVERPLDMILAEPDNVWTRSLRLKPGHDGTTSAPIRSPRGRYLWLRARLIGPGDATPKISKIDLHYPRRGLADYLPQVARGQADAADFTERFLGNFERTQRSIEHQLDRLAALFDVDTAPSSKRPNRDVLGWLASWIGQTLDRGLGEETRRRLLRTVRRDLARKGTLGALRNQLLALIGLDPHAKIPLEHGGCVPCEAGLETSCWSPPILILEHFRLRHWLIAGLSRLDANSELWGYKILNHTILDEHARLGTTQLNTYQDPRRGPFHRDAHRFSVFLPAWVEKDAATRRAARAAVEQHRPAHAAYAIHYVAPTMRLGQQARLGFDAVIARRRGIPPELGTAELGQATVLAASHPDPAAQHLGTGFRLTSGPSTEENSP